MGTAACIVIVGQIGCASESQAKSKNRSVEERSA